MGSIQVEVPIDRVATKAALENDRRDVKDLWNEALVAYREIVGDEYVLKPTFSNVQAMITFGTEEMNNFHKWRHDDKKVDKLRSLFVANLDHIEKGAQKLIAAATPAFPPAAAISTALTFVLSACRSVSADYDVVNSFFADMNSFLQRVSILEGRLPTYRAYQACLMDVFTSLLKMCGFATKFIKLGRFKKWAINAFRGEDGDLAGARKGMDKAITRLQSATEFAILANTEDIAGSQKSMQSMQVELMQNQEVQNRLAANQQLMLETMMAGQTDVQSGIDDIKKLLVLIQQEKTETAVVATTQVSKIGGPNRLKSIIAEIPDNEVQLQILEESYLAQTCEWFFQEPEWQKWLESTGNPLLVLRGPPGMGKSHLAYAIYNNVKDIAKKDPGGYFCSAYFFCRDITTPLKSFQSIINSMVLQISDQNIVLREQMNAEFSKEDNEINEDDYFEKLIVPLFQKESKYQLYLVVDAVNELQTDMDRSAIALITQMTEELSLRIKIIATTRTKVNITSPDQMNSMGMVNCVEIQVTKDKVVPDLKVVIADRLQSTDSGYRALRELPRSIKQRIMRSLVKNADSILYADQFLLHLNSIGREGATVKELDFGMPRETAGLWEKLIRLSERRTPIDLFPAVKFLFAWLTFCFDPLTLGGANQLVQMVSNNNEIQVEDEIQDIYGRLLRIGTTRKPIEDSGDLHTDAIIHTATTPIQSALTFDDDLLEVSFRKRSLREYFFKCQVERGIYQLGVPESVAQRQIFLTCCQIIKEHTNAPELPKGQQKLHQYALRYCLRHWGCISVEQHTEEENAEVYEAFANLFRDRYGFAGQIEAQGPAYLLDKLLSVYEHIDQDSWDEYYLEKWEYRSRWIQDTSINPTAGSLRSRLSPATLKYWTRPRDQAWVPLAAAHAANWLNANDTPSATNAYKFLRRALLKTDMKELVFAGFIEGLLDVHEETWPNPIDIDAPEPYIDEVYRLQKMFLPEPDSNAHYALGVILDRCIGPFAFGKATAEFELAYQTCKSTGIELFRNLIQMARLWVRVCRTEEAGHAIDKALSLRDGKPSSMVLRALNIKARILTSADQQEESKIVFQELRDLDTAQLITGHTLYEEYSSLYSYLDMETQLIDWFVKLRAIEGITLLTFTSGLDFGADTHTRMLDAATLVHRHDDLIKMYEKMIRVLDVETASAPFRNRLAHIYWKGMGDMRPAKDVLNKVLDSTCRTQVYPVTNEEASVTAISAVNMMSDICYHQFRASRDSEFKNSLIDETQALLQRPLPQSVQVIDAQIIPHLQVVAKMQKRLGRLQDFQRTLQQCFDICWDNLHDSITGNDAANVCHLAKTVIELPGMRKDAEILSASQLYFLESSQIFLDDFEERLRKQRQNMNEKRERTQESGEEPEEIEPWEEWNAAQWLEVMSNTKYSEYSSLQNLSAPVAKRWTAPYCTAQCGKSKMWEKWFWDVDPPEPNFMYTCLCCTNCVLCQQCYDTRLQWNKEGKPETLPNFCCGYEQYLRSPMNGWLGLKDTKIYVQGEEPVAFDIFLNQVRKRWNEAWEEFWEG